MFEEEYVKFWQGFGKSKHMILSTALNDIVTSRTMSVINLNFVMLIRSVLQVLLTDIPY